MIRRLRAKVAGGENAFVHRDGVLVIATVSASEEAPLTDDGELLLADDGQGNFLLLEVDSAHVVIAYRDGRRLPASVDLRRFVDALRSLAPPGLELGPVVEEPRDLPRPRRRGLDDY